MTKEQYDILELIEKTKNNWRDEIKRKRIMRDADISDYEFYAGAEAFADDIYCKLKSGWLMLEKEREEDNNGHK